MDEAVIAAARPVIPHFAQKNMLMHNTITYCNFLFAFLNTRFLARIKTSDTLVVIPNGNDKNNICMGSTASSHFEPNTIKTIGLQNATQKTLIGTSIALEKDRPL